MTDFLPTGIELSYLVAASLFILGLKQLGSPATARQGNFLAAVGMLLGCGGDATGSAGVELPDDPAGTRHWFRDWRDRCL